MAKKLHITVGESSYEQQEHTHFGETFIFDGKNGKKTVKWKFIGNRFVTDPPPAELGQDYYRLRTSAALARQLQKEVESFGLYPTTDHPSLTTIAELVAKAKSEGSGTRLDPREAWSEGRKTLAAKYNVVVTSDIHLGSDKTAGTITIDGVTHEWTFIASSFELPNGVTPGVIIPEVRLDETQKNEICDAVVNELQAGALTFPEATEAVEVVK